MKMVCFVHVIVLLRFRIEFGMGRDGYRIFGKGLTPIELVVNEWRSISMLCTGFPYSTYTFIIAIHGACLVVRMIISDMLTSMAINPAESIGLLGL